MKTKTKKAKTATVPAPEPVNPCNRSCACQKPLFNPPNLDRFRPENFWYEDQEGNRWAPTTQDLMAGIVPPKDKYPYQVTRSGCEVRTGYPGIGVSTSSANPELVRALCNRIDPFWKDPRSLEKALQMAATACERCMNILAHQCGLSWGYAADSFAASRCHTCCDLCK